MSKPLRITAAEKDEDQYHLLTSREDETYQSSRLSAKVHRIINENRTKSSYETLHILFFIDKLERVSKFQGRPVCVTVERDDILLCTVPNEVHESGSVSFSNQCLKLKANVYMNDLNQRDDNYPSTRVRLKVRKYNRGGASIGRYVLDMADVFSECKMKLSTYSAQMNTGILIFFGVQVIQIAMTERIGRRNGHILSFLLKRQAKNLSPKLIEFPHENKEDSSIINEERKEPEPISYETNRLLHRSESESSREIHSSIQGQNEESFATRSGSKINNIEDNENMRPNRQVLKEGERNMKESKDRWKKKMREKIAEMSRASEEQKEILRRDKFKLLTAELENQLISTKMKLLEIEGDKSSSQKIDEAYETLIKVRAGTEKNETETVQLEMELNECEQELQDVQVKLNSIENSG